MRIRCWTESNSGSLNRWGVEALLRTSLRYAASRQRSALSRLLKVVLQRLVQPRHFLLLVRLQATLPTEQGENLVAPVLKHTHSGCDGSNIGGIELFVHSSSDYMQFVTAIAPFMLVPFARIFDPMTEPDRLTLTSCNFERRRNRTWPRALPYAVT